MEDHGPTSSAAQQLFKEMGALFGPLSLDTHLDAPVEPSRPSTSKRNSMAELINSHELGSTSNDAVEKPSTGLLSPFALSSATFESVGSPSSPETKLYSITAASQAPPVDVTPAGVDAPKLDGSMPRFPTPDTIALGLTPSSPSSMGEASPAESMVNERRPSKASPLNPNTRSRAPSPTPVSPGQDSPASAARPRTKSFLGMRLRTRSVAGPTEGTPPAPMRPATTLMGLGFQAESPTSPAESMASDKRSRRPSLSSVKLSKMFSKRDLAAPPLPSSPALVLSPSPGASPGTSPVPGRSPQSSPVPQLRKAQSFLFSPEASYFPTNTPIIPYHMHGVPTTVASPTPPRSPAGQRRMAPPPLALGELDFSSGINLPSATSALWKVDDGPYAALRSVGRSTAPSSPVSPVMARPKIALTLEPTITAAPMIATPRRSVSLTTMSEALPPQRPERPTGSALLSPESAFRPLPIRRPTPPEEFLPAPSPKALRRLSSLSALPDRLAEDRVEERNSIVKATPSNLRRRSSLSYLQPLAIEPKAVEPPLASPASLAPSLSYFPAVPSHPAKEDDADSLDDMEAEKASERGTMSASSSIERFARAIGAGLAESVDTHSNSHSEPPAIAPPRPPRPSTRVLDLVNLALGPLADVIAQVAKEDAEKAKEITGTSVEKEAVLREEQIKQVDGEVNVLDNGPLVQSPETEAVALPEVKPLERTSLDSLPSVFHSSNDSNVEIVDSLTPNNALDKSFGATSCSSSVSDLGTPLFDRTRRDSSESAPPSEASHGSSRSRSSSKQQQQTETLTGGPSRLWANTQAWQQRLSIRRDVCEDDGSSDGEDEDESNPIRKSFVGHYAQLIAEEDETEDAHSADEADEGDAYSSSGVEDADSEEDEVDDDDVPLGEAHPGALQAQRSMRESQGNKRPSPRKSQTAPVRNPFSFEPNKMVKRDRRGNEQPLPAEAPVPPARPPSTIPPHPVGHPMLPQTDAMVRLRSQRSLARLAAAAAAQVSGSAKALLPSKTPADTSADLPSFLQDSVLAISESEATPAPIATAPADNDDNVPLGDLARAHSVSKALASLTKKASGMTRSRSNTTSKSPTLPPSSPPRIPKTSPPLPSAPSMPSQAPALAPIVAHTAVASGPSKLLAVPPPAKPMPRPTKLGTRRVYIGGSEIYTIIELTDRMLPRDVLREVQKNGDLPADGQSHTAGWALFELWRDLGVERPIREYERINAVVSSWPRGNAACQLVLKRTPFARLTSARRAQALKKSDQPVGNYVKLEVKRGKWEKRWLVLDGESLYSAKSERAKERTLVCTMTNWDVYFVPGEFHDQLRAPLQFALGLKSTDALEMFENVDEASCYFCCKTTQEATTWYNLLFDARSRHCLALSQAQAPAPARPAPQPSSVRPPFKEGSLLASATAKPISPIDMPASGPSPFVAGSTLLAQRSQEDQARLEAVKRARHDTKTLLDLSGGSVDAGSHAARR